MDDIIDLSPNDADPPVRCDRGVTPVPTADRRRHAPDRLIFAVRDGSLVARCSCWWRDSVSGDSAPMGIIGHYAAANREAGGLVLSRACGILAAAGCTTAAGPIDATTWRGYRFIVERGSHPPFFLEPDHPADWPEHWSDVGFAPLATYTSSVTDDLHTVDLRTSDAQAGLAAAGISIRAFDPTETDAELGRLFTLSGACFEKNYLYRPISEDEFREQYAALLPLVRAELILIAERESMPVGFVFAVPDVLQARRGAVDTVIVKTTGVDPSVSGMGLGSVLVDLVQRRARRMGFRRAIHALMHDTNRSRRISDRCARPMRRYAVLSRPLAAADRRPEAS